VIYQTLPEPANPNYTYENREAFQSGDIFPNSGHVAVTVSPGGIKVDYIRSYLEKPSEIAFSYTISPSQVLSANVASTPTGILEPPVYNVSLGRPTADTISLSLYAQEDLETIIQYRKAYESDFQQTGRYFIKAQFPQVIELVGLQPDTTYLYKVIANGTPSSEHTFHTQRAAGSSFTFTIDSDPHFNDPQFNGRLYSTTLSTALEDNPDFHINLGDTFMTEKYHPKTYEEAERSFSDLRPYFSILNADAPLFLVNGNHEGELGWLLKGKYKDLPIWSSQLRQLYYPGPTPNTFYTGSNTPDPILGNARDGYYAWTWGDALFIVLDPFWYTASKPIEDSPDSNWNWTLGKAQYDWLKSILEVSTAKYKLLFIHHLVGGADLDGFGRGGIEFARLYEWGGQNPDGSYGFDEHRPGWGKPIHELLVENKVSAVFHGHDHVFVRQELDGIVYQECPQPSNTGYNSTRLAADYGYLHGDILGSAGYLRVSVTPELVTVEYVRAYLPEDEQPGQQNGQVDFEYVIK